MKKGTVLPDFRSGAAIYFEDFEYDRNMAAKLAQILQRYSAFTADGKRKRLSVMLLDPAGGQNSLEAAAAAGYLIIICSVHTKHSARAEQTIRSFLKRNGRKNLLSLLIGGEPQDAFPDSLVFAEEDAREPGLMNREIEPLAADVRSGSVKQAIKKLEKEALRIVSTMLDRSYSDMAKSGRARKTRKIVGFSVLPLLLAGIALVIAVGISALVVSLQYRLDTLNGSLYEDGTRELAQAEALQSERKDLESRLPGFFLDAAVADQVTDDIANFEKVQLLSPVSIDKLPAEPKKLGFRDRLQLESQNNKLFGWFFSFLNNSLDFLITVYKIWGAVVLLLLVIYLFAVYFNVIKPRIFRYRFNQVGIQKSNLRNSIVTFLGFNIFEPIFILLMIAVFIFGPLALGLAIIVVIYGIMLWLLISLVLWPFKKLRDKSWRFARMLRVGRVFKKHGKPV